MKSITLKELKLNLSEFTEEAHKGKSIEVTRYNKPYVQLNPLNDPGLHRGKWVGKRTPNSIGKNLTKGKFLEILSEDRNHGENE